MDTITVITPVDYQKSSAHKELCDSLLAQAGLTTKDVQRLEFVDGSWVATIVLRDENGRIFADPNDPTSIAKKLVTIDPQTPS